MSYKPKRKTGSFAKQLNGTERIMAYDNANRLTSIQKRDANGFLIPLHEFSLDDVGKIEEMFSLP